MELKVGVVVRIAVRWVISAYEPMVSFLAEWITSTTIPRHFWKEPTAHILGLEDFGA